MIARRVGKRAMEQSNVEDSNWITTITEIEREVAEVLVDWLPHVFFARWGARKKRSAIKVSHCSAPSKAPSSEKGGAAPSSEKCGEAPSSEKGGANAVVEGEAPSPNSPLLFPPAIESDQQPNAVTRKSSSSLKRRMEDDRKAIEDETTKKATLEQEIAKVKNYHDQLFNFNLRLKFRRKQLDGLKNGWSTPLVQVNAAINSLNGEHVPGHATTSLRVPSSSTTAWDIASDNSNKGQLATDLNFSFEESILANSSQPLDGTVANKDLGRGTHKNSSQLLDGSVANKDSNLSKVAAAQARQKRIKICRSKKEEPSLKNI